MYIFISYDNTNHNYIHVFLAQQLYYFIPTTVQMI